MFLVIHFDPHGIRVTVTATGEVHIQPIPPSVAPGPIDNRDILARIPRRRLRQMLQQPSLN